MKPWMIEKIRKEKARERSSRVPLHLPLTEVSPSGSAPHEEGGPQGSVEVSYRV